MRAIGGTAHEGPRRPKTALGIEKDDHCVGSKAKWEREVERVREESRDQERPGREGVVVGGDDGHVLSVPGHVEGDAEQEQQSQQDRPPDRSDQTAIPFWESKSIEKNGIWGSLRCLGLLHRHGPKGN